MNSGVRVRTTVLPRLGEVNVGVVPNEMVGKTYQRPVYVNGSF